MANVGTPSGRGSGRVRLLDAALGLIGEKGLHALTIRDVADTAGLSLGSATYHFADRAVLLEAALQRFVDEEIDRCRSAVAAGDATTSTEVLMELVFGELTRTFMMRPGSTTAQMELYVEASRNQRLAEIAEQCIEAYRGMIASALMKAGVTAEQAAKRAARIITYADGIALQSSAIGGQTELPLDARAALWLLATSTA